MRASRMLAPRVLFVMALLCCALSFVSAQRCSGVGNKMVEMGVEVTPHKAGKHADAAMLEVGGGSDPICGHCGWFCWWEYVPNVDEKWRAALQRCDCLEREHDGQPTPGSITFCQTHARGHIQATPRLDGASATTTHEGSQTAGSTGYITSYGKYYRSELPLRQHLDDIATALVHRNLLKDEEGRMLAYVQCNTQETYIDNTGSVGHYPPCHHNWPREIYNVFYHEADGPQRVANFAKALSSYVLWLVHVSAANLPAGSVIGPNGAEMMLRSALASAESMEQFDHLTPENALARANSLHVALYPSTRSKASKRSRKRTARQRRPTKTKRRAAGKKSAKKH